MNKSAFILASEYECVDKEAADILEKACKEISQHQINFNYNSVISYNFNRISPTTFYFFELYVDVNQFWIHSTGGDIAPEYAKFFDPKIRKAATVYAFGNFDSNTQNMLNVYMTTKFPSGVNGENKDLEKGYICHPNACLKLPDDVKISFPIFLRMRIQMKEKNEETMKKLISDLNDCFNVDFRNENVVVCHVHKFKDLDVELFQVCNGCEVFENLWKNLKKKIHEVLEKEKIGKVIVEVRTTNKEGIKEETLNVIKSNFNSNDGLVIEIDNNNVTAGFVVHPNAYKLKI